MAAVWIWGRQDLAFDHVKKLTNSGDSTFLQGHLYAACMQPPPIKKSPDVIFLAKAREILTCWLRAELKSQALLCRVPSSFRSPSLHPVNPQTSLLRYEQSKRSRRYVYKTQLCAPISLQVHSHNLVVGCRLKLCDPYFKPHMDQSGCFFFFFWLCCETLGFVVKL